MGTHRTKVLRRPTRRDLWDLASAIARYAAFYEIDPWILDADSSGSELLRRILRASQEHDDAWDRDELLGDYLNYKLEQMRGLYEDFRDSKLSTEELSKCIHDLFLGHRYVANRLKTRDLRFMVPTREEIINARGPKELAAINIGRLFPGFGARRLYQIQAHENRLYGKYVGGYGGDDNLAALERLELQRLFDVPSGVADAAHRTMDFDGRTFGRNYYSKLPELEEWNGKEWISLDEQPPSHAYGSPLRCEQESDMLPAADPDQFADLERTRDIRLT